MSEPEFIEIEVEDRVLASCHTHPLAKHPLFGREIGEFIEYKGKTYLIEEKNKWPNHYRRSHIFQLKLLPIEIKSHEPPVFGWASHHTKYSPIYKAWMDSNKLQPYQKPILEALLKEAKNQVDKAKKPTPPAPPPAPKQPYSFTKPRKLGS